MAKQVGASRYSSIENDDFESENRLAGNFPEISLDSNTLDVYASFDFIDINLGTKYYSFNNADISLFDLNKFHALLKSISGKSVSSIANKNGPAHFKLWNIKRIDIPKSKSHGFTQALCDSLGVNINIIKLDDLPYFIYQANLYNSDKCQLPPGAPKKKAPRVYFVLGNRGCFSVIMIDLFHSFFPSTDLSS